MLVNKEIVKQYSSEIYKKAFLGYMNDHIWLERGVEAGVLDTGKVHKAIGGAKMLGLMNLSTLLEYLESELNLENLELVQQAYSDTKKALIDGGVIE